MKILITGNLGYVGTALSKYIFKYEPNIELYGYDTGFFGNLLTATETLPEKFYKKQLFGDTREFTIDLLEDIDSEVHLDAISNDPIGNEFE